jgi:hypothetical protein
LVVHFLTELQARRARGMKGTNMGSVYGRLEAARREAVKRGWAIYRKVSEGGRGWELTIAGEDHLKSYIPAVAESARSSE